MNSLALEWAVDVVGDRWTLLVLHQMGCGVGRFNDIQRNTQITRDGLTRRLRRLERMGVIVRSIYCSSPPRFEYSLTRSGEALKPALAELQLWGTQFAAARGNRLSSAPLGPEREGSPRQPA